jgi:ABC-2 type transport system permease protein
MRRLLLVARQELSFNARRPMFYICLIVVAFIIWGLASGNVQIIISSGDASVGGKKAWLTSEFAVAQILSVTFAILISFFVAAAAGMSVIRDGESKVGELLHATPLTAGEYVWGKYLATFVTAVGLVLLQLVLMVLVFHVLPNAEMKESRGPFDVVNYLRPAFFLTLPTLVFVTGTAFGIGTWTRRAILVFILPIFLVLAGFFFLWSWSPSWLGQSTNRLLMLVDPAGVRWLNETYLKIDRGADYYNSQRIGFDATFLLSRLAIFALGLGAVWGSARHFARTLRGTAAAPARRSKKQVAEPVAGVVPLSANLQSLGMRRGAAGFWATAWRIARAEMRELRGQPGLYLFIPLIVFETITNSLVALGAFDTPLLLTSGTLAVSQMNFLTTLLSLLLIFYAVESMERERATGFAAIHDALPIRTGALIAGKVIALSAIGLLVGAACLVACIIALLVQGKVGFSAFPFVLVWGALVGPTFIVWTSFVIAAYCVTKNRYSTYGVALAAFGYTAYLLVSNEVNWIGNWALWGSVRWSDMSHLEIDRVALVLSRVFALGLAAFFFRVAVRHYPRRDRDAVRAIHALRPQALARSFVRTIPALALPLIAGGALWWQIDHGPNGATAEKRGRDYWKKNLATWKDAPIPAVADVDLDVTLEPAQRAWRVKGSYVLVNERDRRLARFPVTVGATWRDITWTVNGAPFTPDTASRLFEFKPATPLEPNDSLTLGFSYSAAETGVTRNGGGAGEFILPAGVVMTSFGPQWFPLVGYVEEIGRKEDENDYEPKQYPDDFYEGVTLPAFGSQLPMTARIAVTAPQDFVVNSVGEKVGDVVRGGTRTVTWKTDHPVMAFNIVAARYQVKRGAGTAIYYYSPHTYNIAEMSAALDAARRWYGEWFGAFPWKELKLSEFPALATYAQGFPTNITFSEGIGFLTKSDPKTNLAFLVTAHESAHQWWGNMLLPGEGPSGNILSEGMAHFSTALLIEQAKGVRDGTEFRKRIESRYGDSRRADAERKLLRNDGSKDGDQTVTYDKGGWVFWMLMQRIGREPTLRGMRDFIARYANNADHAVLHDFVVHMRTYAPDTAAYDDFVRQWFDSVVVPEYRVHDVKTRSLGPASWETTAEIENVGTGRMPIDVAAVQGERWPEDSTKKAKTPYAAERTTITLDGKQKQRVAIRTTFKPEKIVVDPDVKVLQLRRQSAEGKVP